MTSQNIWIRRSSIWFTYNRFKIVLEKGDGVFI